MPRRRPSPFPTCLFLFATAAFILSVAFGAVVISIPAKIHETFGPPSPRLSKLQEVWLMGQLAWYHQNLTTAHDSSGAAQIFQIASGESPLSIAQRLQDQGLISEAQAWLAYLQYTGLDTSIQAGRYTLSAALSPLEIAQVLQDATPQSVAFHVLAGWRMEEVAEAIPASGLNIRAEDFLALARKRPQAYPFSETLPPTASAEGFLFAGGYEISRSASAADLLAMLLAGFEINLTKEIREGFKKQGLTLYEGVILASIVEREAIQEDEMPQIASVYLNRRAIDMKLDADPTVQYALGFNSEQNTWWTNPLSLDDLKVNSPYNTYQNPKFPPGPICNPGLAALQAAAFPAQTPYYYFRAACDHSGRHLYAETFEQHQANACP